MIVLKQRNKSFDCECSIAVFDQTVLSRVRRPSGIWTGLGGTGGGTIIELEVIELLFEAEDEAEDDKLTKCVVSAEDCGLKTIGPEVRPLTGELPEVNPSSAELEWRPFKSCPCPTWIP